MYHISLGFVKVIMSLIQLIFKNKYFLKHVNSFDFVQRDIKNEKVFNFIKRDFSI